MGLFAAIRAYRLYTKLEGLLGRFRRLWRAPGPVEGKMQGYRTIAIAAIGLLASLAAAKGFVVEQDTQVALAGLVVTVIMIIQRIKTTGPISWRASTVWYALAQAAFAALAQSGVVIEEADRAAAVLGLGALVTLILRALTRTPVGGTTPTPGGKGWAKDAGRGQGAILIPLLALGLVGCPQALCQRYARSYAWVQTHAYPVLDAAAMVDPNLARVYETVRASLDAQDAVIRDLCAGQGVSPAKVGEAVARGVGLVLEILRLVGSVRMRDIQAAGIDAGELEKQAREAEKLRADALETAKGR